MARALKISYLPFRAMAEPTRLILRFGGVPYTDELVWGPVFSRRRQQGDYPFGKVLGIQTILHWGSRALINLC